MSFKPLLLARVIFPALFISGCQPALYQPAEEMVTPAATLQELKEGRKLYIQKCGGCHTLILPEKYPPLQWRHFVESMTEKAKSTPPENELMIKYLTNRPK